MACHNQMSFVVDAICIFRFFEVAKPFAFHFGGTEGGEVVVGITVLLLLLHKHSLRHESSEFAGKGFGTRSIQSQTAAFGTGLSVVGIECVLTGNDTHVIFLAGCKSA